MRRFLLSIVVTVLVSVGPLLAQSYEVANDIKPPPERGVATQWIIGTVFLIGCLVVAFKPAKRVNLR